MHAQVERPLCRLINFSVQQAAARKNRSFIHRILYLKQSGFIDDCLPAIDKQLQIPAAQAAEIVHETAAFRPGSICRGKGSCAHACSYPQILKVLPEANLYFGRDRGCNIQCQVTACHSFQIKGEKQSVLLLCLQMQPGRPGQLPSIFTRIISKTR